MAEWKRVKEQEDVNVYRWFEKNNCIASIVRKKTDLDLRVSCDSGSFELKRFGNQFDDIVDEPLIKAIDNKLKLRGLK